MNRRIRAGLVQLWFAVAGGVAAGAAAQEDRARSAFAAGVAAFEQRDYRRALSLFQEAEAAGGTTAAMLYNIGVCQYRLGDYAPAAATFERLAADFPSMRALADYNRGLSLLGDRRLPEAQRAFQAALANGPDERLASLARRGLQRVTTAAPRAPARWHGLIDFGVGHDDNVALIDDVVGAGGSASPLAEGLGYVGRSFSGPLRLDLSGYLVRYSDRPEFDQDAVRLDVAAEVVGTGWRFTAGPHLNYVRLADEPLEQSTGLTIAFRKPIRRELLFDVRFIYDDIESLSTQFDYLVGSRWQLRLAVERRTARGALRFGYDHEENDRVSANVSPERDRYSALYRHRFSDRWSIEGSFSSRDSRYARAVPLRTDRLAELGGMLRRELAAGWSVTAQVHRYDNDSTQDSFNYDGIRSAVTIGKAF